MSVTEKVKEHVKLYHDAKNKMMEDLSSNFSDLFKEFFKENPEVKTIAWTQYTPYFCDGAPCEFNVGDMYLFSVPYDQIECSYLEDDENIIEIVTPSEYSFKKFGSPDCPSYIKEIVETWNSLPNEEKSKRLNIEEFLEVLRKIPDEIYQHMFGDHVKVFATPDGFETEHYEHD